MNNIQYSASVPNAWTLPISKKENMIHAIQPMKMPGSPQVVHQGVPNVAIRYLVHVFDQVFAYVLIQLHIEARCVKRHIEPVGCIWISGVAVVPKILVQQHFGAPLPLQTFKGSAVELGRKIVNEELLTQAVFLQPDALLNHTVATSTHEKAKD